MSITLCKNAIEECLSKRMFLNNFILHHKIENKSFLLITQNYT